MRWQVGIANKIRRGYFTVIFLNDLFYKKNVKNVYPVPGSGIGTHNLSNTSLLLWPLGQGCL